MRVIGFLCVVAAATLPTTLWADVLDDLAQPAPVAQMAYEYDTHRYLAADDAASAAPTDDAGLPVELLGDECCEPSSCSGCDRGLGEPWTLFGETCSGITAGGWISSGLYSNAWGAPTNGLLGMRSLADGYTMNQFWTYLEKPLDGSCGWDWGARVDYMFGVDGPDYQAFGDGGWDFGWNSSRDYGSTIPNLYAEVGNGDLTIKGGHFITSVGWECLEDTANFFTSRSLAYYWSEPTTHTGFLGTYVVNDAVSLQGGWVAGWDSGWENRNDASMMLGGATLALTDNTSIVWAFTAGDQGHLAGVPQGDIYMNSICFEWTLTDDLTYVLHHDLGSQRGAGAVAPAQWAAIVQYLQYQVNERWATAARFEWFQDDDGARTGFAGDFYEVTLGVNYKPHANVIIRPEIRGDWYNGVGLPYSGHGGQFAGGFDVIFTF